MTIEELCKINKHYKISYDGAINTRCPFCGDSQKPGHLVNYGQAYIYPDGFAKCFRCGRYSTASEMILQMFLVNNVPVDSTLLNSFKTQTVKKIYSLQQYTYIEQTDEVFKKYPGKIKYLSNRLQRDITLDYINKCKFIIDLDPYKEYITHNIDLDKYIGYLTYNKRKLILRSVTDNKINHLKIDLTGNNMFDYWSYSNSFDQLIRKRTIVLGEGLFDVENTAVKSYFNDLPAFAALSKNNLINTLRMIFFETFVTFDVILLRDIDVDLKFINFIYKQTKKFVRSISIYQNLNGSDFGDVNPVFNFQTRISR